MTIEKQYQAAYRRALSALTVIDSDIHDMPAPESDGVNWGSVADMQRIASDLESITRYTRYTR